MPQGSVARHYNSNSIEGSRGPGLDPYNGGLQVNPSTLYPDEPSRFYRHPRSPSAQTSISTLPRSPLSDSPDQSAVASISSSETPSAYSPLSDTPFQREPLGPRWHDYSFRESDLYYNASPQQRNWGSAEAAQKSSSASRLWAKITRTPGSAADSPVVRPSGPSSRSAEARKDTMAQ